jgi:hypothetical protein
MKVKYNNQGKSKTNENKTGAYSMPKIESENKFVDKSGAHGLFNFDKDGVLKIGGIAAYMTPMASWAIYAYILGNHLDRKKVTDITYYVGKIQGIVAVRLLRDKFGIRKQLFDTILEQLAMVGLGRNEIVVFNETSKQVILKKKVSPFPETYVKIFGYQADALDHFHRGDIAGVLEEMFGEEMIVIEKECKSQGKDFCITEAFPKSALSGMRLTGEQRSQVPDSEDKYPEIKKIKENCTSLYLK